MVNVDDDGIKMFGIILLVAIILILLSTCVLNEETGGDDTECPEGTYYLEKFNCCTIDGLTCYVPPTGCVEVPCNDEITCCVPDVCELQQDGSEKCKPCSLTSPCNPLVKSSCCENMFCDALTSFCADCEAVKCISTNDCCPDYECASNLCTTCERSCALDVDCCPGWECSGGQCINCIAPCDNDLDCCSDYTCNNEKKYCEGCKEGAYCDAENPCCNNDDEYYECNLDLNECQNCERPCDSDSDCCVDGTCDPLSKTCFYPDDCSNMFCSNPGELCQICPSNADECILCKDNTICSTQFGFPFNLCKNQGSCPVGLVECSGSIVNCNCCDPVTGKCMDEKTTAECNSIEGCATCSCKSYEVILCPKNNVYCPGKGCYNPADNSYNLNDICHTCSMSSDACCTPLIPSDALPLNVIEVDYDVCLSGYKFGSDCVSKVVYFKEVETPYYIYWFHYGSGQLYLEGKSKVGPSEVVISSVKIVDEYTCNNLPGIIFTQPQYYSVG